MNRVSAQSQISKTGLILLTFSIDEQYFFYDISISNLRVEKKSFISSN